MAVVREGVFLGGNILFLEEQVKFPREKVVFRGANEIVEGGKWERVGKNVLHWRATAVFLVCRVVSRGEKMVNRGDNVLWRSVR